MHVLSASLQDMRLRDFQHGQYGLYDPAAWQAYVDFMLAETQIQRPVPIDTLFTNALVPEINQFDHQAVIAQAKSMDAVR